MYDAVAVLGKAYDFEKRCFPDHMYKSLRIAARLFNTGKAPGGIAVCGAYEIKALERGKLPPATEAIEMRRYLVDELGISPSVIYVDNTSTTTPENFLSLRAIAARQGWRNILMPMAARRIPRAMFLGTKICFGLLNFTMEGVDTDDPLATEEKLLGDMVCTLKDMKWGDYRYLLNADGSSRWNEFRKAHYNCPYYELTDSCKPYVNFHPESLMKTYGVMP